MSMKPIERKKSEMAGKITQNRERSHLKEYNNRHSEKHGVASMGEYKGRIKETAAKLGIKNPKF